MNGQTIARYKILEKLGDGGMGVVFKAEDTQLHRTVALKFLPKELACDLTAQEQLFHEAQTASALDHPNICTIYEVGKTEDGQPFICMAYYSGETLTKRIEKGSLRVQEAIEISVQTARGLQKAHEAGIIHRDIKPANMILTNDGFIKIIDFGLANVGTWKRITRKGATIGTAAYMSPEQIRGERIDYRSDIWSLGVCLYEMLTGKIPFEGDYEPALMYSILNDDPQRFINISPQVTGQFGSVEMRQIEGIVKKCLEKKPEDRYQTMAELILDITHLQSKAHEAVLPPVQTKKRFFQNMHRIVWILIVVVILGIFSILSMNSFFSKPELKRKSIAVLPFKNLDNNQDDEYFSDGITEDVITQISRFGDLTVISRTSVMQYKNTKKTIPEIARELNVGTILEGSVRRLGNRVRIVSQLIDVGTDTHIWSETYDRQLRDVFLIQSDVAQKISQALKVTLRSEGFKPVPERSAGNITAYEHYLRGREYYYRFNKSDNEFAVSQFKMALDLEPNYAAALAGLADAYAQRVAKFGFPPEWVDSAITISNKAISIDVNLAEAHKALGLAYSGKGWHHRAAQSYQQAVELNPNYLTAVNNLGVEYSFMGEFDNALIWFKKSLPLNPTFPFSYYTVGGSYSNLDDYEKAREWFNKCIELQPDFQYVHAGEAVMYLRQGDYQHSFIEAKQILAVVPDDLEALTLAGWSKLFNGEYTQAKSFFEKALTIDTTGTYWYGIGRSSSTALGFINLQLGQEDNARKMFQRSRRLDQIQLDQQSEWYTIRYDLALINAQEGNKIEAYRWLRKAIDVGWRDYHLGQQDPLLKSLQGDDEFKQMISGVQASIRDMRKRWDKLEKE